MGKNRILLVEDEEDLVEAMVFQLEAAGYEVLVARDGLDGLDKAKKEKIDLLLEKKDLSNREMNKLSRLMEASSHQSGNDSLKTLEMTESVKVNIDPKAANRDTSFWNTTRPIPLAAEELQSPDKATVVLPLGRKRAKRTGLRGSHERLCISPAPVREG